MGALLAWEIVDKVGEASAIIKKRLTIMDDILKTNQVKLNISRRSAGEPGSFQLQLALFRLYFLTYLFWHFQPL